MKVIQNKVLRDSEIASKAGEGKEYGSRHRAGAVTAAENSRHSNYKMRC